jgi:UDP-GlcNAc3NAcA epimerase
MERTKILTVIGARPQFIKASPVNEAIRNAGINEILVHTGQHYDTNMSDVFFSELNIPIPDFNLAVGSGSHGFQTATMLNGIEKLLIEEAPDCLLIYGDTNSTLAGALAASKLHVPIAHIEAGLRSFNWKMPEEVNRVVADRLSQILFCPSMTATKNLLQEGISQNVHLVGDVMYDAVKNFSTMAAQKSLILETLKLQEKNYYLATIHRAENTDIAVNIGNILDALSALDGKVVLPLHPRTRNKMLEYGYNSKSYENIQFVEPVGYLDMLHLQQNSSVILTDSGGIQKEAYWLKIPCVTLRNETEWVETVESNANIITGANQQKILAAVQLFESKAFEFSEPDAYGDGTASSQIVEIIKNFL